MPLPLHELLLIGHENTDWICADEKENIFIKEAIYEGDFSMASGVEFGVESATLDHWDRSIHQMIANGVEIPMPEGHTTEAGKKRGKILGAHVGRREDGKKALFLRAQFNDAKAADQYKHSQVSIHSPPEFTDGAGHRYVRPITHVALTDYPVIPGLKGFESIAASFVEPESKKENLMPLKELAKRLNIECDDEAQLADTIVASFESVNNAITENRTTLQEKDTEIAGLKAKLPNDPVTVSASHKSMLKDNRVMKLDRLVGERISPAVKDGLVDLFCSDNSLTLSLSSEAGDGGLFDKLVELLDKNETIKLGETSEVIMLSKDDLNDPEKNPLLANMEKRKKAS